MPLTCDSRDSIEPRLQIRFVPSTTTIGSSSRLLQSPPVGSPGPANPLGFTPNDWFFTGPPECGIPLILRMYTPLTSCTLTGLVAARLPVPVPHPRVLVRCSLHHHLDPILSACHAQVLADLPYVPSIHPPVGLYCALLAVQPAATRVSLVPGTWSPLPPVVFSR